MPRLDNSDELVVETYNLHFDEDDPGGTEPVDLCDDCGCAWLDSGLFVDHPPYENGLYLCCECGDPLTEADDWFE